MRFYLALPILAVAIVPAHSAEPDVDCRAAAERVVTIVIEEAEKAGKTVTTLTGESIQSGAATLAKRLSEDPGLCTALLYMPDSSLQAIFQTGFINEPNDG